MSVEILLVLLAGVIALLVVLLLSLSANWSIMTILAAVSPQPVTTIIHFSQMWALGSVPRIWGRASNPLLHPVTLLVLGYALAALVATDWSQRPAFAVGPAIAALSIVAAIALADANRAAGRDMLLVTVRLCAPLMCVQSLSTIVFQLFDDVKETYLHSAFAGWLIGDQARLLFTTLRNNVTDPTKSGGLLFVNANRASMVMAAVALCCWAASYRSRLARDRAAALICFAGALSTGSKTAVILAVVLPLLAFLLPYLLAPSRSQLQLAGALILVPLVSLGAAQVASRATDFTTNATEATEARDALWTAASAAFADSPFRGLGWGGWAPLWSASAERGELPATLQPHNFLIWAWANTGLLGALCLAGLHLILIVAALGRIRRAADAREGHVASFELAALLWMLLHGMYDNTEYFGTEHTIPLFAMLVVNSFRPKPDADGARPGTRGRAGSTMQRPRTREATRTTATQVSRGARSGRATVPLRSSRPAALGTRSKHGRSTGPWPSRASRPEQDGTVS